MVAKVRFWLLERSGLITKVSLSVMILKSLFLYSLFTSRPCFTRKATPPLWPVDPLEIPKQNVCTHEFDQLYDQEL